MINIISWMAVLLPLFLIKLGESRRHKKITILFEYLRSYVTSNEFIFVSWWWKEMTNSVASFFLSRKEKFMRRFTGSYVTNTCDNSGQIFLLEINIDDSLFVLINIYNANNQPTNQSDQNSHWFRWNSWLCWWHSKQKYNFKVIISSVFSMNSM